MKVIRLGFEEFSDVLEATGTLWEHPVIEEIIGRHQRMGAVYQTNAEFSDLDIGTMKISD